MDVQLSKEQCQVIAKAIDGNNKDIVDEYKMTIRSITDSAKVAEKKAAEKKSVFVTIKDHLPALKATNTIWEVSEPVLLKGVGMKTTHGYIRRALQDWPAYNIKAGAIHTYSHDNVDLPRATLYAPINKIV